MRRGDLFMTLSLVAVGMLANGPVAGVRAADAPAKPINEQVKNDRPSFYVRAQVDHPNRTYTEGDTMSAGVVTGEDAYVYVYYQQADKSIVQLFPNKAQTDPKIAGGKAVLIPAKDARFRWRVSAPFGKEVLLVVASKKPLKPKEGQALSKEMFSPVSEEDFKGITVELDTEPAKDWTSTSIEITTTARGTPVATAPGKGRRLGVFFGVSEYKYNEENRQANDGEKLNIKGPERSARELSAVMKEAGRLDDFRVFTNAQATRKQMEEMITGWLAKESAPGDTVFIYFSGHGSQLPDDNGDEADKLDEFLLTHDFLDFGVVSQLLKGGKKVDDLTDPALRQQIIEAVRSAGEPPPRDDKPKNLAWNLKINNTLIRNSAVTDDLFGQWIQKLDNRHVIVIVDSCHSGGLANLEKDIVDSDGFDFLDRELERLKDIGQGDAALLTACSTKEYAQIGDFEDDVFTVFTYQLIHSIRDASGPINLASAYKACVERMKHYFESDQFKKLNESIARKNGKPLEPYAPILYDSDKNQDVYLRP